MASDIKTAVVVGSATTGGTSQNITIPSLGWTPKAAIIIGCQRNSDGPVRENSRMSIGFTDGTTHRAQFSSSKDNLSSSAAERAASTSSCIILENNAGLTATAAMIADGIALTWSGAPAAAYKLIVILLGGADLSVAVGTFTPNSTNGGTASVSGLSFQPTMAFFTASGGGASLGITTQEIISLGAVDSVLNQAALMYFAENGQATTDVGSRVESNSVAGQYFNGSLAWTVEITAINADGFTGTTRDGGTGGDECHYLAIDTGDRATSVDQADSPTATGNKSFSPGFTPQLTGLLCSRNTAIDTSATSDAEIFGVAAFTDDKLASYVQTDDDGVTTTNVHGIFEEDALDIDDAGGTTADFDATLVDAATLNFSVVDGTARKWWSWQIEEVAAAGAARASTLMLTGMGS